MVEVQGQVVLLRATWRLTRTPKEREINVLLWMRSTWQLTRGLHMFSNFQSSQYWLRHDRQVRGLWLNDTLVKSCSNTQIQVEDSAPWLTRS